MLPEGLGALKKLKDPIGNRIRYLQACSLTPQPSMLQLMRGFAGAKEIF
jgi:hypothetical protein